MGDSRIEELKKEDETLKKTRQKKRVRGVLVVITALLLAYTGYLTVQTIVDKVNENAAKGVENTITLLNKSAKESLSIYGKYFNTNSNIDVSDVSTYGKYLIASQGRNYVDSYKINNSLSILEVVDNKPITYGASNIRTLGDSLDSQLNLYSLPKGTYLLFDQYNPNDINSNVVYHYSNENYFETTIYSFKDEEGTRKKITLKGKASSPSLVVEVSELSSLPTSYYDIVIYDPYSLSSNINYIDTLKQNYDVYVTSSLVEAYKAKTNYAISLYEGNNIFTSAYTSLITSHDDLITTGPLSSLDKDNSIRELGGYIFNAGYGYYSEDDKEISSASIEIKNHKLDSHVGKYVIKVGNEYPNIENDISTILMA